jgi:hypothetical protein
MSQKFYANPDTRFVFPNKAVGYGPGGPFDYIGHFAKVDHCPIAGTNLRRTCYATGYADTYFSIPASTKIAGKHVSGYFSLDDGAVEFNVMDRHWDRIPVEVRA